MKMDEDYISAGTMAARRNTWGTYNRTAPTVERGPGFLRYSTSLVSVEIWPFDEIILHILLKFLWMPVWLMERFFGYQYPYAGLDGVVQERLSQWEQLGIVWTEEHPTGTYVRPTHALFQMFSQEPTSYNIIPANLLTHTVCEETVCFEVMTGISPILKKEKTMPRVSELGLEGNMSGTNILPEIDFRYLARQDEYHTIMEVEHELEEAVRNGGPNLTAELKDFRWFTIAKKVNNTGTVRQDYRFHIPDLIIPNIRQEGKPMSIAIEVELSNKRAVNYEETMLRYRDNTRFAAVYWLCDGIISAQLHKAYDSVGGTGSTRMEVVEFQPPVRR